MTDGINSEWWAGLVNDDVYDIGVGATRQDAIDDAIAWGLETGDRFRIVRATIGHPRHGGDVAPFETIHEGPFYYEMTAEGVRELEE